MTFTLNGEISSDFAVFPASPESIQHIKTKSLLFTENTNILN